MGGQCESRQDHIEGRYRSHGSNRTDHWTPAFASHDQQRQLVADQSHQTSKGAVTPMPADTPTIVFVHGAWADASGWGASINALRDHGFAAISFANPLRHLT